MKESSTPIGKQTHTGWIKPKFQNLAGNINAHYSRNVACISIPIIPTKLLQPADRLLPGSNFFEGIIGTEIHAHFMASLT